MPEKSVMSKQALFGDGGDWGLCLSSLYFLVYLLTMNDWTELEAWV